MTPEEKRDLKNFNDYLKEWWRGNKSDLESDPRYKEYSEAIGQKNPIILFARNMGAALGVQNSHEEYVKQLYNKYK